MFDQYNREMDRMNQGFTGIGRALLERKLRAEQKEQQAFENRLRQQMQERQQRQDEAMLARAERDFGYRKERDQVGDARYTDQTTYGRGRDTVADQRYQDQTTYTRGRDGVGDQRYDAETARRGQRDQVEDGMRAMELSIRKKAAEQRGNLSGYETQELDEDGRVISTKRRVPLRGGDSAGGTVTVRATGDDGEEFTYQVPRDQFEQFRQAAEGMGVTGKDKPGAGPATPAALLEAVKSGKMSKEQAKAYAQKKGWK